jgi:hypothetical protein
MANQLPTEIIMPSHLNEIADVIERLRSAPEVLSRINGRIPYRDARSFGECRYPRQPPR